MNVLDPSERVKYELEVRWTNVDGELVTVLSRQWSRRDAAERGLRNLTGKGVRAELRVLKQYQPTRREWRPERVPSKEADHDR